MVGAAANYPLIRDYTTTPEHFVEVQPSGQTLGFNNSNALVKNVAWDIQLQKTGYIREAGRCVVMQATIDAKPVIIVLLHASDTDSRTLDANRIKHWLEGADAEGSRARDKRRM